jgi:hypothetical protein
MPSRVLFAGLLLLAIAGCRQTPLRQFQQSLFDRFPQAEQRAAIPHAFARENIVIDGQQRRVIYAHAPTRLTWAMKLPARARLTTAIALKPQAWTGEGDGVVFRIGIADDRRFEALFLRHVNPFANSDDRRAIPVSVDLSGYGGWQWSLFYRPSNTTWRLVLATDAGLPGSSNAMWDWAVWVEPTIEWTD